MKALRLYRDEQLIAQLGELPIAHRIDGAELGDPEDGCPPIERAMAFALAVSWAPGTMQEILDDLEAGRTVEERGRPC